MHLSSTYTTLGLLTIDTLPPKNHAYIWNLYFKLSISSTEVEPQRSTDLLEKMIVAQLLKNVLNFYKISMFITVSAKALQLLSQPNAEQICICKK